MTQWHEKSNRKISGGLRRTGDRMDRRLSHKGGDFTATTLNEEREININKGRGSTVKPKLRSVNMAVVTDPKTKKSTPMKIIWVHENNANRLYTRRNIITKGTLIEVEKDGSKTYARVTNRPGQDGSVNAVVAAAPIEKVKPVRPVKEKKAEKAPKAPKTDKAKK